MPVSISGLGTITGLDQGLNVTGIISATSFSGALTGNVTGNLTGDVTGNVTGNLTGTASTATAATTAYELSGTPNLNVGVVTATSFSGDGSALTGLASDAISEGNTSVECVDTGSDGHITFDTEGTERARINSSGDIGINGTTNPNYHLTFANTSSRNAGIDYTSGSDDTNLDIISAGPSGGWKGRIRFFTSWSGTATEGMRLDENRNLQFNSGYGSVATAYGVRAWGNFVCSGGSPGDRRSENFSSLQDLGNGDFRFYFTNNMPDANYCVVAQAGSSDGSTILAAACPHYNELLTSRIRVITRNSSFTNTDAEWLSIAVIR